MIDIPAHLDLLDKHRKESPEAITQAYQNQFSTPDGKLILIDLMDKFFEFKPTKDVGEAGAQGVLIYIKNKILGKHDYSEYEPKNPEEKTNVE